MTWYCSACIFYLLPFAGSSLVSDVTSSISDKNKGSDSEWRIVLTPVVNGFRIAHLNCRSLLLHKEEIFSLMRHYHLDVLALYET